MITGNHDIPKITTSVAKLVHVLMNVVENLLVV